MELLCLFSGELNWKEVPWFDTSNSCGADPNMNSSLLTKSCVGRLII